MNARASPRKDSAASPRQVHDFIPDIRRQRVPAGGKLAQAQISAGNMQAGGSGVDATILRRNDLRIWGRGCNSRRLHSRHLREFPSAFLCWVYDISFAPKDAGM
jgi:hypothetical protein